MGFTERELELIAQIEQRTGQKIGTFEERTAGFKKMERPALIRFCSGLENCLYDRLNLDNADCFDSEEEQFKTKILQENLTIIAGLLA
ncbi:MAG TPA: hypothetical protein VFQ60_04805 [Patescibacteria group bacterium]|nr:hypothetical protein [Patescibacteria group bacterium]